MHAIACLIAEHRSTESFCLNIEIKKTKIMLDFLIKINYYREKLGERTNLST